MRAKFLIFLATLWSLSSLAASGMVQGPQEINFDGKMEAVTRLPDGRLFTAMLEGRRSGMKWSDTTVAERVLGRYSSDHGLHWTEPEFLLEIPPPGILNSPIPLASRDGTIHLFIRTGLNLDRPINWDKSRSVLWYTALRHGRKSWDTPRKIDFGGLWLGTLMMALQLKSGRIILPLCSASFESGPATGLFASKVAYSDDDGLTWKRSRNTAAVDSGGKLIESGSIEPVVAQLADGRVWMVMRTQTGYMFESYSRDGGVTWSTPQRTIFRASSSPPALLRLSTGPLVLLWNNEFSYVLSHGVSYCRQSLTMAMNDGSGWKGYRQINPPFGQTDGEFGVADYPFMFESGDGGIVVGYMGRRHLSDKNKVCLFRVDPRWLLETHAEEDFSQGLKDLYMVGTAGGEIQDGPEGKPALRLKKLSPEQPSGMSWNFPLAKRGTIHIRMQAESGFGGVYFTLSEYSLRASNNESGSFRWMIGPDLKWKTQYTNNGPYMEEPGPAVMTHGDIEMAAEAGRTLDVKVEWDCALNTAKLYRDGHFVTSFVNMEPGQGISWIRIASAATGDDPKGFWVTGLTVDAEK